MKKVILLVVCIMMFVGNAVCETEKEDEIPIIDMAEGGTIFDCGDVVVTLDPGYEVNQYGNYGEPWNYIDAFGIIENNTDERIIISADVISINGWQTDCSVNDINWSWPCVEPHLKMKLRFTFDLYLAGVKEVDEITDFRVSFKFDPYGGLLPLYKTDTVILIP